MIEKGKCPICGKNNGCAVVAGTDPYKCWCMTNTVPKQLLTHIPKQLRNQSCICHDCIRNYNKKVCVIGSLNVDSILKLDNFPKAGETVRANDLEIFFGGKGGNQAIAASKLGLKVSMIASIGNDHHGDDYITHLKSHGINTELIKRNDSFTGQAFIELDHKGENKIITIGGANYQLNKAWVDTNLEKILDHDLFLISLEIPKEVSLYIMEILSEHNKSIVLDPAPYKNFDSKMLDLVEYVTPNETEYDQIKKSLKCHHKVIFKKGSQGASYLFEDKQLQSPVYKVNTVDTVGAGDTFNAAIAFGLIFNYSIEDILSHANIAGGVATTKFGAQTGMPTLECLLNIKHTSK